MTDDNISTDPSEDTVEGSVRRLEVEIGLHPGFLEKLKDDDDWSFIIKTHALFEAAVAHLLCTALGHEELADVLSFLELSDKRRGKMAFVSAMDLLEKPDRRFISTLSELRNKLVHDVTKAQFSLQGHVDGLTPTAFRKFASDFDSFSVAGTVSQGEKVLKSEDIFRSNAKIAVWWSAMGTLGIIYQVREIERLKREMIDRVWATLQDIVSSAGTEPGPSA